MGQMCPVFVGNPKPLSAHMSLIFTAVLNKIRFAPLIHKERVQEQHCSALSRLSEGKGWCRKEAEAAGILDGGKVSCVYGGDVLFE